MKQKPLQDKIALVTGPARGIGLAIAKRLAEDGADVAALDLPSMNLEVCVQAIEANGQRALPISGDVTVSADWENALRQIIEHFGQLDILVNNAGRFIPKKLLEMTEAEFDAILALNAKGPYFAMQAAARVLSDGGRIVNISSALTHLKFPGATAHLGSKAALEQYGKGLAQELAARGITVNTVLPGFTDTGVLTEQYRSMGEQLSPFKRLGLPSDVADVVAFLVSEQARWLTGQVIQAGGGLVM